METAGHSNMCRCCASEGAFKDIKSTYRWMGEEEVYADMLKDCFDISLNVSEQGEDGGICEVCITQLRNAVNFKKQVQHTEEQFKKHLQNKTLFRPNIVKVEVGGDEDSDGDIMGSGDDTFSGAEFEVPIKTEDDEPKPKKRKAGPLTRSKKAKGDDDGEPSTKRAQPNTLTNTETNEPILKSNDGTNLEETPKRRREVNPKSELIKHRKAIREILQNCNATPIRKFDGVMYACSYCEAQFPNPANLKAHSLTHNDITQGNFIKTMTMNEFLVKLDITGLKCNNCQEKISTLDAFVNHQWNCHQRNIPKDYISHIFPFRFDNDIFECVKCSDTFDNFRNFIKHTHIHFRNYICSICDAGFAHKSALIFHSATHKAGAFVCDYCPKIFPSHVKKREHEKTVHANADEINKCTYCEETFEDYAKKRIHLASAHGIVASATACQACDKVVTSKRALTIHMRRVHLLEKPHKCQICDKGFYSTSCLKNHMVRHTRSKEFQCKICSKFFGRKKSLNAHLKTHDEGSRVRCDQCGQVFAQKWTLKCHIKSKHGNIANILDNL